MAEQMYIDPATGAVTPKRVPGAIPIDPNTGAADPSGRVPGTAVKGFTGGGESVRGGLPGAAGYFPPEPGSPGGSSQGGGGGSSGGVGAGKSYDPDNMINTYLPGLTPEQHAAVRDALKGSESGSGVAYHTAINALAQAHPELQSYTKWGHAFPAQTPGMLSPEQSQKLWAMASAYEQPYFDAMQNTSNQMSAYLKQLMPSLPKGYQSLVKAQMEGPGGLLNLPSQVSNLIHQQNPAAIANAYAQSYGGTGTTPTATASNLFAGLTAPKPTG